MVGFSCTSARASNAAVTRRNANKVGHTLRWDISRVFRVYWRGAPLGSVFWHVRAQVSCESVMPDACCRLASLLMLRIIVAS